MVTLGAENGFDVESNQLLSNEVPGGIPDFETCAIPHDYVIQLGQIFLVGRTNSLHFATIGCFSGGGPVMFDVQPTVPL